MCSITNTAHPTRRHACLGVGVGVCGDVNVLPCLDVVSSDALRSSVIIELRQRGACNQGGKAKNFYCGSVTRRHSFSKCVLTTLLKKYIRKKTSSSDKVSFISPIRDADWLGFQITNQWDHIGFFFR